MESNGFSGFDSFLDKGLSVFDNGSFFRQPLKWVYFAIGILGAIFQFFILYLLISNILEMPVKFGSVMMIIFFVIFMLLNAGLTFFYWFKRSKTVSCTSSKEDKLFVIPIIANIIQCCGEIAGLRLAIFGVMMFFAVFFAPYLAVWMYFLLPIILLVVFLILGFLVVFISRYIAEKVNAIAIIANNVNRIAIKEK